MVRGGRNRPYVGGGVRIRSNFVGERSGPVNEGRIRSSKSGDGWAGLILSGEG